MYKLMSTTIFLFLITLSQLADASSTLEGRVKFNELCPDYAALGHSKVILDDGRYSGSIRRDGSFSIPEVNEGTYILNVLSHDYAFDSLRIDVHPPSSSSISEPQSHSLPDVRPYIPGTPHNPPSIVSLTYPIVLSPKQKAEYFVEHQSFNALGMLRNPMVLMMLVTGVLVFGMPYLIKSLDPDIAKELNQRQARISGIQSAMQTGDFRGGISALLAENERENADASSSSSTSVQAGHGAKGSSSSRARGGKGGRRR